PSHHRPAHRKLPTIRGVAQVGGVLHASRGRWIKASRFTYRWELCNARGARCKAVGKVKRPKKKPLTYVIPARDLGHTIRLTVVASNRWGKNSATSRATAVIAELRGSGQNPVGSGTGTT